MKYGLVVIETRDSVTYIDVPLPEKAIKVPNSFYNDKSRPLKEVTSSSPEKNPLLLSCSKSLDLVDGLCTSAIADFVLWGNLVQKSTKSVLKRFRNYEIVGSAKLPSNSTRIFKVVKVDNDDHLIAIEPPRGPGKERLKVVCKCGSLVRLSRVKKHECKFNYRHLLNMKSQREAERINREMNFDPYGNW